MKQVLAWGKYGKKTLWKKKEGREGGENLKKMQWTENMQWKYKVIFQPEIRESFAIRCKLEVCGKKYIWDIKMDQSFNTKKLYFFATSENSY